MAERLRWLASKQGIYKGVLGSDVLVPLRLLSVDYPGFMPRKSVARLADLIDPTTTVDETDVETVADAVHLCECNECGHSFEWVYGEYEYCPRCGSRIVGGYEYEKASNPVPLEGGGAE